MKINFKYTKIFVNHSVLNDSITRQVLEYFPDIPHRIVEPDDSFLEYLASLSTTEGKRILWLTHFKGRFLKPCPGTAESYRCCNYLVINETTNCPIDCTYCILQAYINNPATTIYTNFEKILQEIRSVSKNNNQRILRIGTGELTDSLALDPVTGLSEKLVKAVQKLPNVLLELKTKTNHINHLVHLDPEKIVLSWSLNPEEIVESEEIKSASLDERLKAAQAAADRGFLIGIHFDPLLYFPNWKHSYQNLIKKISRHINPEQICWISLGSLRYPPQLKETALNRFPKSKIFSEEQIGGMDGKKRYLRPVRIEIYRSTVENLKKYLGDPFIYFCMESESIWKTVLGKSPANNLEVDFLFADSISKKFPDLKLPKPEKRNYLNPINLSGNKLLLQD